MCGRENRDLVERDWRKPVSLYCNNEEAGQDSVLPVRSCKFWVTLLALFSVVIVLTMLKDWWLTTEEPNILFYLIVPISSVFGGVLSMCSVARFYKLTITFTIMLAISMVTNTIMQVVENVSKIIYYFIWEYPGYLYILFVIPSGFLLMVYGLVRWGKVTRWMAVILAVFDIVGSIATAILLTDVIGLTTPGS
jgi:hypothetical protein